MVVENLEISFGSIKIAVPVAAPRAPVAAPRAPVAAPRAPVAAPRAPVAVAAPRAPVAALSGPYEVIQRRSFGMIGTQYKVTANHFLVDHQGLPVVAYQYDVVITPEVKSRKKRKQIFNCLCQKYKYPHFGRRMAYDGTKSAFAADELPFKSCNLDILVAELDGCTRARAFKVNVKFAAKLDVNHLRQFLIEGGNYDNLQESIQALDVVLREIASKGREIAGRSILIPVSSVNGDKDLPKDVFSHGPLGNGVDYWKGFCQSLRLTQMGLSLNIDMTARAFYSSNDTVSHFVMAFLGKNINVTLSCEDLKAVKDVLKGVRVEVSHGGADCRRTYKVKDITDMSISQLYFSDKYRVRMSVPYYFRKRYKIDLKCHSLPAIQAGTPTQPIYLPMEICRLVDSQLYRKKFNERQVTTMLKATCRHPSNHKSDIDIALQANKYNQAELVYKDFGLRVSEESTLFTARVLPSPTLLYRQSGCLSLKECQPVGGEWNMSNLKMFKGGKVTFWAIIDFSKHKKAEIESFCRRIIKECDNKGMEFANKKPLLYHKADSEQSVRNNLSIFFSSCTSKIDANQKAGRVRGASPELFLVILPNNSSQSYKEIKNVCETELGIVSQCCKEKHVSDPNLTSRYFENIALKINVKVGGKNTVLSQLLPVISKETTIVFGADVTHPRPGEYSASSIAAVVASMDSHISMYRAWVSTQTHREGTIENLQNAIREHLHAFFQANRNTPHRIIFYRGGVSEGQFKEVLAYEMAKIKAACASISLSYNPLITYIIVQKRHHTRLFPVNHGECSSTDKSGNILPGTVVDTNICHPREFDFYLCSHAGIQGTSRPAHYNVLYDENNFSADDLQMLTNNLCYIHARCTRFLIRKELVDPIDQLSSTSNTYFEKMSETNDFIEQDKVEGENNEVIPENKEKNA